MVTASAPTRQYTIDDLASFPDDGRLRELVDGRIVEWDVPSQEHGAIEAELTIELGAFVRQHRLGRVTTGDAMVRIEGSERHVRGGDIEYYSPGRFPKDRRAAATTTVPDFVIEILSPNDPADEVMAKVRDWLRAGVRLLWYVDPPGAVTVVYQGDRVTYVDADEELDGGDVVPGFRLRLADLLRALEERDGAAAAG